MKAFTVIAMYLLRSALALAISAGCFAAPAIGIEKLLTYDQVKPRAVMLDGFEQDQQRLIGAWAFTAQIAGSTTAAEFLVMDGETFTGTNGITYLVVERAFTTTGLGLVARTDYGKWLLLLDTGVGFYRMYEFDSNGGTGAGLYWLYQSGGSPTGAGSWMRSFRFGDANQVATAKASGPAGAVELHPTHGDVDERVLQHADDMSAALHELAVAKLPEL